MTRLRVIAPGDGGTQAETSMSEAIELLMKECIAASPSVAFLAWEAGGKLIVRALPDSVMVQKGFVLTLYELVFESDGTEPE